jgi:hypothetical protein
MVGMHEPDNLPMNWVITYDDSIEVIRAVISGGLSVAGIKTMMIELLEESRNRDLYRLLCDCRDVTTGISLADAYTLPAELRTLGVRSYHMFAFVYSAGPVMTPLFTFLDDRAHNVGLSHKTFTDYDLACLWLTGIDWYIVSNPTSVLA